MIEPVANSANYQIARKLLDASVLRQEAIASNIANAETPGYRRIDVNTSFAQALRSQLGGGQPVSLDKLQALTPQLAEDTSVRTVRPDGNSVEIETELMAMSRNRVDHEFLTNLVSSHVKNLKMAITGRVV